MLRQAIQPHKCPNDNVVSSAAAKGSLAEHERVVRREDLARDATGSDIAADRARVRHAIRGGRRSAPGGGAHRRRVVLRPCVLRSHDEPHREADIRPQRSTSKGEMSMRRRLLFIFHMRRSLILTLSVFALMAVGTPSAMASSVHLKGGAHAEPTFTDLGLILNAMGELAGLGNGDVLVTLSATRLAVHPGFGDQERLHAVQRDHRGASVADPRRSGLPELAVDRDDHRRGVHQRDDHGRAAARHARAHRHLHVLVADDGRASPGRQRQLHQQLARTFLKQFSRSVCGHVSSPWRRSYETQGRGHLGHGSTAHRGEHGSSVRRCRWGARQQRRLCGTPAATTTRWRMRELAHRIAASARSADRGALSAWGSGIRQRCADPSVVAMLVSATSRGAQRTSSFCGRRPSPIR